MKDKDWSHWRKTVLGFLRTCPPSVENEVAALVRALRDAELPGPDGVKGYAWEGTLAKALVGRTVLPSARVFGKELTGRWMGPTELHTLKAAIRASGFREGKDHDGGRVFVRVQY